MSNDIKLLGHDIVRELNKILCIVELIKTRCEVKDEALVEYLSNIESSSSKVIENFDTYRALQTNYKSQCEKTTKIKIKKSSGYILIDDDSIVREQWLESAKKSSTPITIYQCYKDFLANIKDHNQESLIFLDSQIEGESHRGEEIARVIYNNCGFKNLILQTGFEHSLFKDYQNYFLLITKDKRFKTASQVQADINERMGK